jgi:hypothetical protein
MKSMNIANKICEKYHDMKIPKGCIITYQSVNQLFQSIHKKKKKKKKKKKNYIFFFLFFF